MLIDYIYGLCSRLGRIILFPMRKRMYRHFGQGVIMKSPVCKIVNRKSISIGDNTIIEKFARIEPVLTYAGQTYNPQIKIGNSVCINQNFHCTCAESISIGDGTSITANCGVFDIIHPYEDITINPRNMVIKVKPIEIGKNCLIGMNSVILPGTILGEHCVVGANSVVSGEWPDYTVLVGSPAKAIKRYNPESCKWEKTNSDGSFLFAE